MRRKFIRLKIEFELVLELLMNRTLNEENIAFMNTVGIYENILATLIPSSKLSTSI